jgi:curli biogenesis system outer membrane secretion channel CsgG
MNTTILSLLSVAGLVLASCTSASESSSRDAMTSNVGVYDAPPRGILHARVAVPSFPISEKLTIGMNDVAADELVSLCANTDRFDVIERGQLDQLLKEQSLEGIVKGGELARPAEVRGVDYLLLGKVTNLRVKAEKTGKGFNLGSIPIPGAGSTLGLFDINDRNSRVQVDCGVDLRLVDPATGRVAVANFAEYQRVDTIGSMGVSVLGSRAQADADLEIDADSKGKILRLALDDCLRKMMSKIDKTLVARAKAVPAADAAKAGAGAASAAASEPPQTPKFCAGCGVQLKPDARFCAGCGAKVGG